MFCCFSRPSRLAHTAKASTSTAVGMTPPSDKQRSTPQMVHANSSASKLVGAVISVVPIIVVVVFISCDAFSCCFSFFISSWHSSNFSCSASFLSISSASISSSSSSIEQLSIRRFVFSGVLRDVVSFSVAMGAGGVFATLCK